MTLYLRETCGSGGQSVQRSDHGPICMCAKHKRAQPKRSRTNHRLFKQNQARGATSPSQGPSAELLCTTICVQRQKNTLPHRTHLKQEGSVLGVEPCRLVVIVGARIHFHDGRFLFGVFVLPSFATLKASLLTRLLRPTLPLSLSLYLPNPCLPLFDAASDDTCLGGLQGWVCVCVALARTCFSHRTSHSFCFC